MEGVKVTGIKLTAEAFDCIVQTAVDAGPLHGFGYWAEVDGVERDGGVITAIMLHEYEEEGGAKKTLRNVDLQVALILTIDDGESLDDDAVDGPWCERVLQRAMFGEVKYA